MNNTNSTAHISGTVAPGWTPVVDAFSASVDGGAGGAALSIWRDGVELVNVWTGTSDERHGKPWTHDTLAVLFSATKGLVALTVARLVEQGRLDWNAPVASYWPEFSIHGKERITVGDVLAHRAGIPGVQGQTSVEELIDIHAMALRLGAQRPLWDNATSHLYHGITFGPLVSEIVLRATGSELPDIFAQEIAGPLGADLTLRATPEQLSRVVNVTRTPDLEATDKTIPDLGDLAMELITFGGALPLGLVGEGTGLNDPRILASGLVSAAGLGTASGLAKLWANTVQEDASTRVVSADVIEAMVTPRSEGQGFSDPEDTGRLQRWGAGVQLGSGALTWPNRKSFGHDGAGGQTGFADPETRMGFGFVTNRMHTRPVFEPIVAAALRQLN